MVGGRVQNDQIPVAGHRVRLFHRYRDQRVPTLVAYYTEVRTGFGYAFAGIMDGCRPLRLLIAVPIFRAR